MTAAISTFFVHTASVETFKFTTSFGDEFENPQQVKGFLDDDRKLVVSASGEEVVSESTFYTRLTYTDLFTVDSRVTVNGRTTRVLGAKRRDSGGLGLPDHLEVTLR